MSNESSQKQTDSQSRANADPGVMPYLVLFGFFVLIYLGVSALYNRYFKDDPAVVTLSAYFVDSTGATVTSNDVANAHLKIRGVVHQKGKPLNDGFVRLSVSKPGRGFGQAVSAPIKGGQLETEDPAFSSLRPEDAIQIKALVSSSQFSETTTEELFLTSTPPALPPSVKDWVWGTFYVLPVVLLVVFSWSLPGRKLPGRTA